MLSAANSPDRRAQVVAPICPFMTYRVPGSTTFRVESFSPSVPPLFFSLSLSTALFMPSLSSRFPLAGESGRLWTSSRGQRDRTVSRWLISLYGGSV